MKGSPKTRGHGRKGSEIVSKDEPTERANVCRSDQALIQQICLSYPFYGDPRITEVATLAIDNSLLDRLESDRIASNRNRQRCLLRASQRGSQDLQVAVLV